MNHNFGEKTAEWSAKDGKEIPVWQSDKYQVAKKKAIEIIESEKYGLVDSDFWILMNMTKGGKMAYSGLILSHNGCLKINDTLDSKFKPECVTFENHGFNDSLVFHYCCPEQGLYEVGEVSSKNCKNEYPYAMALKRCFDRVVLKLCKLAYSGIYSDSELEEFSEQINPPSEKAEETVPKAEPKKEDAQPEFVEPKDIDEIADWRGLALQQFVQKGYKKEDLPKYFDVSKDTTGKQWKEIYIAIMQNKIALRT